jgi:hypothetical protein
VRLDLVGIAPKDDYRRALLDGEVEAGFDQAAADTPASVGLGHR